MTSALDVIHDDTLISLEEALKIQADYCLGMGSRLSHDVLMAVLAECGPGGALGEVLTEHQSVRAGDLIGLRLMAAAHRLVLARQVAALAEHYPTAGGHVPQDDAGREALGRAVVLAFRSHPDVVRDSLARIPQTNETGRAVPLRGALGRIAAAHSQPIRLHELAASAGLNLRADVMPWAHAPMPVTVKIVERSGCDLHPLDVSRAEHRLLLASYVWGDDLVRFERLRTSFGLARRIPANVVPMSAGHYLTALAQAEPTPGRTLVIWHSATWFYLDRAARTEVRTVLRKLAHRATPSAPVVHVWWEWLRDAPNPARSFALVGRSWPAAGAWAPWRPGTPVMLGSGPSHGMPMRWMEPKPMPTDPLDT